MPSAISQSPPRLRKWERPLKTAHDLPWADIKVIDISTFDEPGEKEKLAEQLRDAVHKTGFFSITGTGLSDQEVQRQYDIGQAFFDLPLDKKNLPEYRCDFGSGNYFGYRAAYEKKIMSTDITNIEESFNVPKIIPQYENEVRHPFFEPYRSEIEDFSRKALNIASKIFTLFSLILELPPDYISSRHAYDAPSEDHLRYMTYHPRSVADDAKVANTWSRAHTDFGSLTLLWNQNIAGLQIKTSTGEWKYVPPVPTDGGDGGDTTGIICNVGDTLSFWSAGYLKSTTHRVVRPPEDQTHVDRLGLFYFVRPGDDVDIKPVASPLLKRLGLVGERQEGEASQEKVTGLQYVRERVKSYHNHSDYADMKGKTFRVGDLEIEDEAD
ncbi:hypothetical protein LTR99_010704 [Exophiala xenobiotica]|uniref:Fe2OG dioxygenase domain-containing protein n=1 Tax=Vermiconidia calcicola TaxID=1690605 RepID=A0AAV9Q6D6_9PEZI|nr:hypothetical protein LTR92_007223 [Exophiala xenobiotica]KAK5533914.1 hypothetical protein LTR25_006894 [Vermiconidia calcicola]KAK5546465.1 hypothetical protein LTR23_003570 [Chaetothyriales sp. CCFEE 6169]KAK5258361.1 hypothetical protein LTR40_008049 [Exophiala xenobiotica]KAK5291851.1 hypothetical protein LTR99_010704 [Exophiala xenobiotica]